MDKKLKILLVNDDGISSPGIVHLAEMAMQLGEVWVAAPSSQCSAMSQKLTIFQPLDVEEYDFPLPVAGAYSIGGTPADCVKTALKAVLPVRPDVVFSGINIGYNAGFDIAYSGTVAAAIEAVLNGIPAIAFSAQHDGSYDVTDNTNSQVFYGYSASQKNVISAVDATRGMCLMAGGSYAQCFYTASNGGQTETSRSGSQSVCVMPVSGSSGSSV